MNNNKLKIGEKVEIQGMLDMHSDLNGFKGTVEAFDSDEGYYTVKITKDGFVRYPIIPEECLDSMEPKLEIGDLVRINNNGFSNNNKLGRVVRIGGYTCSGSHYKGGFYYSVKVRGESYDPRHYCFFDNLTFIEKAGIGVKLILFIEETFDKIRKNCIRYIELKKHTKFKKSIKSYFN